MIRKVKVRVPATSANLGPGFDCLGMSLGLYNEIQAEVSPNKGVFIEISGEGAQTLARNESNLIYKTMSFFAESRGLTLPSLSLSMHNEIPSTRGLGSSATAIVAGLALANELLECGLTKEDLVQIATEMEGHPDNVAPAVLGGIVVAGYDLLHRNVFFKRFEFPSSITAVVAIPAYEVSTDKSRQALPLVVPRLDAVFNVCQVGMMMASLATGDFATFATFSNDRLHEPYRLPLMSGAAKAMQKAQEAGASCVTLSGSGPTLLALCENRTTSSQVAKALEDVFENLKMQASVYILKPDTQGLQIM